MERIWKCMRAHIKALIVIQMIILGGLMVWYMTKERTTIDTPLETWKSSLTEFDGETWHIDESMLDEESAGGTYLEFLHGAYINLPRGSYNVYISYEGTTKNYCKLISGVGANERAGLKADDVTLEPDECIKKFRIEATDNIANFELQIIYGGVGALTIKDITICENRVRDVRHLVYLFLVFLTWDIALLAGGRIKEKRMVLVSLLVIAGMASLPEMIADLYYGHDIYFHLLRIEGIAKELRQGNFPVRMHSLCMDGYGYPLSIYYGDIFLYFPALLRLTGFSVINAYKIYILAVNVATTCVSYICLKKMFRDWDIAITGTLAYVTSAYRLMDVYMRASVGEYTAMLAFPIVALAIYRIYEADNYEDWKDYRKNALLLAIGMSVLIGSHILSTEMVVFVLGLISIVLYKKTFRKNTLRVYILAVLEAILLNAYFLMPFLDYWMNVDVNITSTVEDTAAKIQDYGAYIGQYFAFFMGMDGSGSGTIANRIQMTPGLILMAALLIAGGLQIAGGKNKRCSFYVAFSLLMLWLGSNLFPWDFLAERVQFFNLLAQVQFPWRYIGIAAIFLTLLMCELLCWVKRSERTGDIQRWYIVIWVCAALMTSYVTGSIYDGVDEKAGMDCYDVVAIDTWGIGGWEYLRTGTNIYDLSGKITGENLKTIELQRQEGTEIQFYCETEGEKAYIEVPRLNYKGYHVRDNTGKEYKIINGTNNVIGFTLPENFVGDITVSFEEPMIWRVAELVSLITAIGFGGMYILGKRKKASIE